MMSDLHRRIPSSASLTGQTLAHLCPADEAQALGVPMHAQVVASFRQLREEGARAGFQLRILSGFRSFDAQLSIWNRKVAGDLPVLDSDAVPLDIGLLTPKELAFSILRWSALPGASRHHWGTELDVFDAAARPEGYEIELVPEEVNPGGMFGPLHDWLDERISASTAFGFFRPYDIDRNGVAPERWHLSHGPVADRYLTHLSPEILRGTLESADIALKRVVLEHLDEIYQRFVLNCGRPPK